MCFEDDNYWNDDYVPEHRSKKLNAPPGVHIMNKHEKEALRKLKAETGLTEEELRKEKKYRKILSDAQKVQGTKTPYERRVIYFVKNITRELKLPLEHPIVIERIKEKILTSRSLKKPITRDYPSVDEVISIYKDSKKKSKKK